MYVCIFYLFNQILQIWYVFVDPQVCLIHLLLTLIACTCAVFTVFCSFFGFFLL